MKKRSIILTNDKPIEGKIFRNLKDACTHYGLSYNTMARKKYPILFRGIFIEKIDI